MARPLHNLTEKPRVFYWSDECQEAFLTLKTHLQGAPILAYPEPEGKFVLDTDASGVGIGAVLSQVQNGEERVIAYASRALSKPERNYCVTHIELLAIVVYLKHFRQYLYGQRITVRTDHAALKWLVTFKDPEGQVARWIEVLGQYNYEILHRPAGKKHGNAEGLSRRPCKQCGRVDDEGQEAPVQVNVRVVSVEPTVTMDDLRKGQLEDSSIVWVVRAKEESGRRPDWKEVSPPCIGSQSLSVAMGPVGNETVSVMSLLGVE